MSDCDLVGMRKYEYQPHQNGLKTVFRACRIFRIPSCNCCYVGSLLCSKAEEFHSTSGSRIKGVRRRRIIPPPTQNLQGSESWLGDDRPTRRQGPEFGASRSSDCFPGKAVLEASYCCVADGLKRVAFFPMPVMPLNSLRYSSLTPASCRLNFGTQLMH